MATRADLISRHRIRPADLWREAGSEPRLSELLSDPLVHEVMRRDGVSQAELALVIAEARMKLLRRGLCRLAA